ncbi:hypothetical protein [Sorangium sp. So ce176]|uniref:hypothetical protein n=1 Tax=Sorangium sp. So ce176 TaxID=3133286 RepID=UPI003F5E77E5
MSPATPLLGRAQDGAPCAAPGDRCAGPCAGRVCGGSGRDGDARGAADGGGGTCS